MSKADCFRKMMEMVIHNEKEGVSYGGAFVIVPPDGGGDPIETLILDSKQDAAQFWSLLQAKASLMVAEIEEKKRVAGAFGRR